MKLLSKEEIFKRVGLSQASIKALEFINSSELFTMEQARKDFAEDKVEDKTATNE